MSKELFHDQRESQIDSPQTKATLSNELSTYLKPVMLTKDAAEGCAELIASLVKDGHENALDVSTRLQWMASTIEQARKLIQPDCIDEIERYAGKATINGAEVIKKETGVKYNYDSCNDHSWQALNDLELQAKEKRYEREKFLKSLTSPLTVADPETGEMNTINPPVKLSTTNIQVTFK